MSNKRVISAARRVLDGDESRSAASDLEAAILDEYIDDKRLLDLLEALALYAPGSGSPYCEAEELRAILRKSIRELRLGQAGDTGPVIEEQDECQ